MNSETALTTPATLAPYPFDLVPTDVADVTPEELREDAEGIIIVYPRVKIPPGGGLNFELPGEDPDRPISVPEITGVIVDHYPVNAFWQDSDDTSNTPPDCASNDGVTGVGQPGGTCATCPLNTFGSGMGGLGKACKNMHRVYIQRRGDDLPLLLTIPPTSLRSFNEYMSQYFTGRRLSSSAVTRVSLKRTRSKGGKDYSYATFAVAELLDAETAARSREYARYVKQHTRAQPAVEAGQERTSEDTSYTLPSEDTMPF